MKTRNLLFLLTSAVLLNFASATDKPKLTLDEFFNSVGFDSIALSPDGRSIVIATERADWDQSIFREDLWLYRDDGHGGGTLTQLTQSGYDSKPQWSPDGQWIAFLSSREGAKGGKSCEDASKDDKIARLFLISPSGGEAFPLTQGDETVHAFAWSADSRALYYSTRSPRAKAEKDAYEKEWKDTCQYRDAERGDTIFNLDLAAAMARRATDGSREKTEAEKDSDVTPGARLLTSSPWRIEGIAVSQDGTKLAFVTESVSEREEKIAEFEIYAVELSSPPGEHPARQLTRNQAQEHSIHWANDSKHVFFEVEEGSVEGKYLDTQPRLYWVDAGTGQAERWGANFDGAVLYYSSSGEGAVAAARQGTEVQLYSQAKPSANFSKAAGWPGTYETIATAQHSPRVAFTYSALAKPTEVYVAESLDKLQEAHPITSFNQLFADRDLPQGKTYRWKADDGTSIEGMLMYPPGKFEAKNLPMFVFIHGGPNDADGNHFEADWYEWDRLAATQGWLVFEPNYRGSIGYGDKFLMQIVPDLVSRPGKDILAGVDALVKEGIADPDHLAVGGYSYGGYMTNWLITQTTRFKAAVTGAGAVEHVANWGNDDTTFDDAYFLGGLPWEQAKRYHDEAAIFYMDKVRTPTHMVAGEDDVRVAVAEDYLLDHALHNLGIPSSLLIFPGEGHDLGENPWHGKIKVREELKWLQKYGGISAPQAGKNQ